MPTYIRWLVLEELLDVLNRMATRRWQTEEQRIHIVESCPAELDHDQPARMRYLASLFYLTEQIESDVPGRTNL